jgi:hypothetical protein
MAEDSSDKPGPVAHIVTWLIVIVGYLYWSGTGPFGSACESAIKNSLLDPGSASISLITAEDRNGEWNDQSMGTFKGFYEVTAKNGFGGYSNERWACAESEGNTFAISY